MLLCVHPHDLSFLDFLYLFLMRIVSISSAAGAPAREVSHPNHEEKALRYTKALIHIIHIDIHNSGISS